MSDTAQLEGRPLELLREGKNFAHVAIAKGGGDVRTVLVWIDADDEGNVMLNSAEGRAWPRELREAGRAFITVPNHENPYEYVAIEARLDGDTNDGADADIDALAKKYLGEDKYPWAQPGERRVTFTLRPERVRHQG